MPSGSTTNQCECATDRAREHRPPARARPCTRGTCIPVGSTRYVFTCGIYACHARALVVQNAMLQQREQRVAQLDNAASSNHYMLTGQARPAERSKTWLPNDASANFGGGPLLADPMLQTMNTELGDAMADADA